MTGRTKKRIARSKRAHAGSLALFDWSQVMRTGILRGFDWQVPCYLFQVLRFFGLISLSSFFSSIEAVAPRSIVPRYKCAPTATRSSLITSRVLLFVCLFFIALEMSLFPSTFCAITVKFLYGEYVVCYPFQLVLYHLVSTGWIVDISLREKSSRQSVFVYHQQRYGIFSR